MTERLDPVRHADNENASREHFAACMEKAEQDYLQWLLTDFTIVGQGGQFERYEYEFEQYIDEWANDVLDKNAVRLTILTDGFEAAGKVMGESLAQYLNAVCSQAVIDKKGL